MCGIFACLHRGREKYCLKDVLLKRLKRRGPDSTGESTIKVGPLQLHLLGTLLCMRGGATRQPLVNDDGDHLMWNGNVFGGCIEIEAEENDTVKVLEALSHHKDPSELLLTLSKIDGPWAFVFWQNSTASLWFGRDVFGRRSLLWHLPTPDDDTIMLSSVGHYDPGDMPLGYWLEVPASGIYQLKCLEGGFDSAELVCYPWMEEDVCFQSETGITDQFSSLESCLKFSVVKERCLQVPFPPLNKQLPLPSCAEKHNLSTVPTVTLDAGPDSTKQDSCGGRTPQNSDGGTVETLQYPTVHIPECQATASMHLRGSQHSVSSEKNAVPVFSSLVSMKTTQETDWHTLAQHLLSVLQQAIHSRVVRAPRIGPNPTPNQDTKSDLSVAGAAASSVVQGRARVALLFSGGVDSVVMAALTDRCLPLSEDIDLINVAFELKGKTEQTRFQVPDRVSAIQSLGELNPQRKWNLVLVNVTLEEVNAMRREHVSHLIYPLCTVLDDSIGCALWFAARGCGLLYHGDTCAAVQYQSRARTLFVGIGADEQLAGYSRHRTKFKTAGWKGLMEEVEMDIKRLARRNLGRDDRCIADHEREGEFPFLDEKVVGFLQQLPIWSKVDLSLPRGEGEKRLLREVAVLLGCRGAASLPKRAIQFGSRMAQLSGSSNSREHGSDFCRRLVLPGS